MRSGRGVKREPSISNISPPPLKRKVQSTTTSGCSIFFSLSPVFLLDLKISDVGWPDKAIANFFTPLSQKKPDQITWRIVNHSVLVGKYGPEEPNGERNAGHVAKRRIAAFDLVCFIARFYARKPAGELTRSQRITH